MLVGESKVDSASGAGRPTRQLVPVRDHVVNDILGASPNVYVRQLSLFRSGFCEDIGGREAGTWVRHVVH